ncbi:acetoin dehydrogenase [Actinoplanes sp. SE50]|uniref:SDR family NAD(P)-dependent oxidoreductase n=1 Tax=unclassified Actinoplanes TaxID=2626549 RepID=UPI00023ECA62|nr:MULTISPECIES: SDR family NAD(P)-dependent oxidoreductase [unclassified Actinoplanes]AEV81502.1 3-oxoacyl-[acyl-carrier-protein] reductase [Actinoplanes sp. SE50/110]ATO79905.1 acetoin dehydrogenase [Actinoplanes sp. SE50]SLL97307.1 acetoin dehydrogenase [Actinoplanes sp. SE50/110]
MRRFSFAGRTCVITGAAGGIGAALALELARRRSVLVLVDKDAEGLERVAGLARDLGVSGVTTYTVDLGDGEDRLDLAAEVSSRLGGADLLINNAGVTLSGTFEQNRLADVEWLLEINLHAVIRMTKAFLPQLLARPGSHLVNISSLFGLIAPPGQVAYATSKFAVRGFTESLRHELTPRGVGVTVVHPGGVRTGIALNARLSGPDPDGEQAAQNRNFHERALTLPPEEAARQIVAAVQSRRPRLVITREARAADLLVRLLPASYWSLSQRVARRFD